MDEDDVPERVRRAFDGHEAFERIDPAETASTGEEDGSGADSPTTADTDGAPTRYRVTTTAFDGQIRAEPTDDWAIRYRLIVRAPTLDGAVAESVGPNLQAGWLETYELRLEDAPGAVRDRFSLEDVSVETVAETAVATFTYTMGNADRAPAVAKAITEYTEGTYVEGVVPGFTYEGPVAELLHQARQTGGDGDGDATGPMPL